MEPQDDYDYEFLAMLDCLLEDQDYDAIWAWMDADKETQEFLKKF